MKLELNQEAASNFNVKAEVLLAELTQDPYADQPQPKPPQDPGIYVHEFPKDAILEVMINSYAEADGTEVAKFFRNADRNIGLFGDGYKKLIRLAEAIQRVKTVRDFVSIRVLKDLIFDWVTAEYKQTTTVSMTEYVLSECEKRIQEIEIWVPINMLQIQSEFQVGRITFKTITKEMLDSWLAPAEQSPPEMSPEAQLGSRKFRKDLQGFAAATIKLNAEPERASEIAFDAAEKATSVLRLFSPVNFDPTRISYVTLSGKHQPIEVAKRLIVKDKAITGYSSGLVDRSSPYWQLDNSYIADLRKWGLNALSDLLEKDDWSDFQERLTNALFLYSKNCLTKDPSDKLVYILVAIESMILKNESEPITKNIGERMAALIGESVNERKAIIDNVTAVYKLRSSFIHHGKRINLDEAETLKGFMSYSWRYFAALITLANQHPAMTRDQFFNSLDDHRLSY